jgi:hypothetical protein
MHKSNWTPSIVPNGDDQNVYIVLDDFGRNGRSYRETDVERVDLEAVIMDMLDGQGHTVRTRYNRMCPRTTRRSWRATRAPSAR